MHDLAEAEKEVRRLQRENDRLHAELLRLEEDNQDE